ncbi:MAG TPA: acetate--CoA ligase family protein [Rubrivivax sp.]|nr:acetate--CoA ligase family protein [Rubrivivax sp.]
MSRGTANPPAAPGERSEPYSHEQLRRLVSPASVAIVGASPMPGSFGQRTQANMARFQGPVYLVNPKYDTIDDRPCYPDLRALPQVPDCAVVAVAGQFVLPLIDDCASLGIGGMVLYASGFAETGKPAAVAAQNEIAQRAARGRVRVTGPNSIGLVDVGSGAGMLFMPEFDETPLCRGGVAIVSQSGALGYTLLQGMQRGVGFSRFLAAGNSCDVDVCDFINFLVDDPHTQAVACILEGVRDGERLLRAGQRLFDAGKTLVVYKTGRGEASREVALSHTGSMIGSAEAYDAAFRRIGAVAVDDLSRLLETAAFFAKAGRAGSGRGVGVMATSGGAAVAAADMAQAHGVALPPLGERAAAILSRVVPDFGRVGNPADTTAEVLRSGETFATCIQAFLDDPAFDALVVPNVLASRVASQARAAVLQRLAAGCDKPIVVVWMNDWLEGPGAASIDSDPRLSLFRSMHSCFRSLQQRYALAELRARPVPRWPAFDDEARTRARSAVAAALDGARDAAAAVLTERESKQLLRAYGIGCAREALAGDVEAAVAHARALGFPVALKVESPQIPHKSEAGVVRLDLRDEAAVRHAYRAVLQAAAHNAPQARVKGVLVQQMAGAGIEVVVGVRRDRQFGALIMVGLGGVLVEVLRDTATRLAPVSIDEAHGMLAELRGTRLLGGYRGRSAADVDVLAELVSRVSLLAADFQHRIDQIDINPVIASAGGAIAVDALIVPLNNPN